MLLAVHPLGSALAGAGPLGALASAGLGLGACGLWALLCGLWVQRSAQPHPVLLAHDARCLAAAFDPRSVAQVRAAFAAVDAELEATVRGVLDGLIERQVPLAGIETSGSTGALYFDDGSELRLCSWDRDGEAAERGEGLLASGVHEALGALAHRLTAAPVLVAVERRLDGRWRLWFRTGDGRHLDVLAPVLPR